MSKGKDKDIADVLISRHKLVRNYELNQGNLFQPFQPEPVKAEDDALPGMETNQKPFRSKKEEFEEREKEKERLERQRIVEAKLKGQTLKRFVKMFSDESIADLEKLVKQKDDDTAPRFKQYLAQAREWDGRREMPTFKNIGKDMDKLRPLFHNFGDVLDFYANELFFAGMQKPEAMRIKPVLLDGEPGVGKTAFAQAFARTLNLPFLKLTPSSLQHGAVLGGTAAHWSNTAPGEIFKLLANGQFGTAVLLIDEADKLQDNDSHPVLPGLLDLLEPETSKTFRDESLCITFDASHLIVIMTSNKVSDMDAALLSRCEVKKIDMPSAEQKLAVALHTFDELNASLPGKLRKEIDRDATKKFVSDNEKMDMRSLISSVKNAFAVAVREQKKTITLIASKAAKKETRRIGF